MPATTRRTTARRATARLFSLSALLTLTLLCGLTGQAESMPKESMTGMAGKAEATEKLPVRGGTVVETMNSAGYTYMLVAEGIGQSWVAIPETEVTAGSVVHFYEGMVMENFTSSSLQRTFPAILFSPGLAEAPAAAKAVAASAGTAPEESFAAAIKAESGQPSPATSPANLPEVSGGSQAAVVPLTEVRIERAPAENGYTVAEIFARAEELAGQKVQVRGKVVKFSPQIMGRNWLHLQDGSGNPMENSHDLVLTSSETVAVESVVTMEGVLAANRDFGAGYSYQAIIEEASTVQP